MIKKKIEDKILKLNSWEEFKEVFKDENIFFELA